MQNLLFAYSVLVLLVHVYGFSLSGLLGRKIHWTQPTRLYRLKPKPMWTDYVAPTVIVRATDFDTSKYKSEMPTTEDIIFLLDQHYKRQSGWYTGIELTLKHYFTRTRPLSVTDAASILYYCGKLGIIDCRGNDLNNQLHTKLFDVMFNNTLVTSDEFVEAMSGFGSCHFQIHEGINLTQWYGHFRSVIPHLCSSDVAVLLRSINLMGMDKSSFPSEVLEVLMAKLVSLQAPASSPPSSALSGTEVTLAMSSLGFEAIDFGNEARAAVLQMTSRTLRGVCSSVQIEPSELVDPVMQALVSLTAMKFKKFDLDAAFQSALDQASLVVMPYMKGEQLLSFAQMFSKLRLYWFNSWSKELQSVFLTRLNNVLLSVPAEQLLVSLLLALVDLKMKASDLTPSMQQYVRDYYQDRQTVSSAGSSSSSSSNTDSSDREQIRKWLLG